MINTILITYNKLINTQKTIKRTLTHFENVMMKTTKLLISSTVLALSLLAGCSGGGDTRADLHRVMDIASTTMETFKSDKEGDAALEEFNKAFEKNLNSMKPEAHPGPVGVVLEKDGSFHGYEDKNDNRVKDSGESEIFKLEIDTENKRILASDGERVADHSIAGMMGGMAAGLVAGMLIGSLLNRQRSAGVNTKTLGNKQANTARGSGVSSKASGSSNSSSSSNSARSRAGSGSHSSGK